jgi:hypothetical protein
VRIQTTGKHVIDASVKRMQELPVERHTVTTRQIRAFRRLGIEQETVGYAYIGFDPPEIISVANGQRLDDGQSVDSLDVQNTLGALIAVQLENVRRQRRDDLIEIIIIGIDGDGNDLGLAANPRLLQSSARKF